jgi:hypothetical integral membrane protein (TIGR02206 family)
MKEFFDPTDHAEVIIPVYGTIHFITLAAAILMMVLLLTNKKTVKRFVNNRVWMTRFMIVYILIEVTYWVLQWAYRVEPMYERFPLHLCASLSTLYIFLILLRKNNAMRFFSYWALSAGFIAYVNPGFGFSEPWSFGFIHYLIRHYFVFIIPVVLQVGLEFRHTYREFLVSSGVLAAYAGLIFLLDWATGANYMHLGQHNPLEIPFLPKSWTTWPWSYPSFVMVGIVLMHLSYLFLKRIERSRSGS